MSQFNGIQICLFPAVTLQSSSNRVVFTPAVCRQRRSAISRVGMNLVQTEIIITVPVIITFICDALIKSDVTKCVEDKNFTQ